MKYAHLDNENKLLGWYSKDVNGVWVDPEYDENDELITEGYWDISNIPTPRVEVSDEEWQRAVSISANYYNSTTQKFELKDFRTPHEIAVDEYNSWKSQNEKDLENLTVDYKGHTFQADGASVKDMLIELIDLRARDSEAEGEEVFTTWYDINNKGVLLHKSEMMALKQLSWDAHKKLKFPDDRPIKPIEEV